MKWKIALIIVLIISSLSLISCSHDDPIQQTDDALPYAVVYNSDKKDNIVLINQDLDIAKKITVGTYIEDMDLLKEKLYLIDSGTLEKPKKDLYRLDLRTFSKDKLELSFIPHRLKICRDKAYVSSVEEKPGKGFRFMVIDLNTFEVLLTSYTQGMVTSMTTQDGMIYAAINSGGPDNYGENAKILRMKLNNKNELISENILREKEELPPGWMIARGDSLYGIYAGFAYGPKPRWLKDTGSYTNTIKEIDLKSGKIKRTITLPDDFPQMMAVKNDQKAFINHYTNLDMAGNSLTILDLLSGEIKGTISTSTPSYLAVDERNLLITNIVNHTLTVFDSNTLAQKTRIPVGKWPKKVLLVEQ